MHAQLTHLEQLPPTHGRGRGRALGRAALRQLRASGRRGLRRQRSAAQCLHELGSWGQLHWPGCEATLLKQDTLLSRLLHDTCTGSMAGVHGRQMAQIHPPGPAAQREPQHSPPCQGR